MAEATTQEEKTLEQPHAPLHSHSAIELHRSPTAHSKPLKSASATELVAAANGKKNITMTRPRPAVSLTSMKSSLPHRMKENNQISINKVQAINN